MSVDDSSASAPVVTPWIGCALLDELSAASHRAIPPLFRMLAWADVPDRLGEREHSALLDNWTELLEVYDGLLNALRAEADVIRLRDLMRSYYKERKSELGLFVGECYPDALRAAIEAVLQTLRRRADPSAWQRGKPLVQPTLMLLANVMEDWKGLSAELHVRFDGFPPQEQVRRLVDDGGGCRYVYCPLSECQSPPPECQDCCVKHRLRWDRAVSLPLRQPPGVQPTPFVDEKSSPPGGASSLVGQNNVEEMVSRLSEIDKQIIQVLEDLPNGLTADELVSAIAKAFPDDYSDNGPSRGHLVNRCQLLDGRGLLKNPGKGYRLTALGQSVFNALTEQNNRAEDCSLR